MPEGLMFRGKYVGKTRNNVASYLSQQVQQEGRSSCVDTLREDFKLMDYPNQNSAEILKSILTPSVGSAERPKSALMMKHGIKRYVPEEYFK